MSTPTATIHPQAVGTWTIDPVHSEVSFLVGHLGVAKVRGNFGAFEGQIVIADEPLESSVAATIDTTSVNTGNSQRDEHVHGPDFLDVANHPTMSFRSTALRSDDEGYLLDGELTLHGVTKPVSLKLEVNGVADGPAGKVAGFSASTTIKRSEFDMGSMIPMVGDKITISLEIEAGKQ